MTVLGWEDKQKAYGALRAVLQALRDRLTVDEVAQLGAQLPVLISGIYYEGWDPASKPARIRHKSEFFPHIQHQFRSDDSVNPEQIASSFQRAGKPCEQRRDRRH
jgi:uncharacterized protein (DUF2267 family)